MFLPLPFTLCSPHLLSRHFSSLVFSAKSLFIGFGFSFPLFPFSFLSSLILFSVPFRWLFMHDWVGLAWAKSCTTHPLYPFGPSKKLWSMPILFILHPKVSSTTYSCPRIFPATSHACRLPKRALKGHLVHQFWSTRCSLQPQPNQIHRS